MLTEELLDFASCPILRFLQKAGEIAEPFCSTENFCRYFKRFGYISYGSTTLWHVIRVIQWLQGVCIFSGEYSGSLRLCRVSILFVGCGLDGEAMCFVFDCYLFGTSSMLGSEASSAIAVALPDASVAQAKIVAITRNVFFFIYMSFRQVDVTSVESRSVFAIVIECCHLLGGRVALNIQTGDIAVVRNRIA